MSLTKQYFKYVSQNIFGLLGTSCYILADTYFISQAAGTSGVALLNLCLPIYNFIFAIGSMLGLGAATRYAILRAQGDERSERYFSNALLWALVFALPFMLAGIFCPEVLLRFMGGDAEIVALGVGYARIFLLFTPFFMCNYIVSAFVRNDGDPSLAMVATLCGSLFNVVFDYIFMFPMGLGLPGAALATAVSPVLSIAICSRHFFKKSSTVRLVRQLPSPAAGPELPAGRLGLRGRDVLRRDHHRLQPAAPASGGQCGRGGLRRRGELRAGGDGYLQRRSPGRTAAGQQVLRQNDAAGARKLLLLGSGTALALAAALYAVLFGFTGPIVAVFNSENSALMAQYAFSGVRIYFLGYFFAGFNIVAAGYLGAVHRPAEASATSLSRGIVAIVACSLVLSALFGMNGVWAAFPASEAITACLTLFLLKRKKRTA